METEEKTSEKQVPKQLKPYIWKKGQSGNLNGRPKGKTLKEFAREYLQSLPDEEKVDYLASLPTEIVWKMAEGNPKNDVELSGQVSIGNLLDDIEHGQTTARQELENKKSLQDQRQEQAISAIQAQPSAVGLQSKEVDSQPNPEI